MITIGSRRISSFRDVKLLGFKVADNAMIGVLANKLLSFTIWPNGARNEAQSKMRCASLMTISFKRRGFSSNFGEMPLLESVPNTNSGVAMITLVL